MEAEASRFVCPSDRQLALRAKLRTGWSFRCTETLQPEELDSVVAVLRRSELLQEAERDRVRKLVERVDNMKRNATGSRDSSRCYLCGDRFGLLGPQAVRCCDCARAACPRCSVEDRLCRICSETREVVKKSGAWFFHSLPQAPRKKLEILPSPDKDDDDDDEDDLKSTTSTHPEDKLGEEPSSPGGAGSVELAFRYAPAERTLRVRVLRCRNLDGTDAAGLSDPYCLLELSWGGSGAQRTRTVHKTLDPEFDEELVFSGVALATGGELMVAVFDEDCQHGDECLGRATVPVRPTPGTVVARLRHAVGGVATYPQVLIGLTYQPARRCVVASAVRARNLPPGEDPVSARLGLLGDRRRARTAPRRRSDPQWTEEFVLDLGPEEAAQAGLQVSVWGRGEDYLGGVVIGGRAAKGRRLRHWLDAVRYPDHEHHCWHHLSRRAALQN